MRSRGVIPNYVIRSSDVIISNVIRLRGVITSNDVIETTYVIT